MFIGLTFVACLLFEMATGTRPHVAQYGLIGLALCVFYLLLLSIAEQLGFALAYRRERRGRRRPGHAYNWALRRRAGPALAFGAILAGLYAGLYGLLQLEDVALLDRLRAAVRRAVGGDVAHPQHPSAAAGIEDQKDEKARPSDRTAACLSQGPPE